IRRLRQLIHAIVESIRQTAHTVLTKNLVGCFHCYVGSLSLQIEPPACPAGACRTSRRRSQSLWECCLNTRLIVSKRGLAPLRMLDVPRGSVLVVCRVPSRQLGVVAGTSSRVPPGREYRSGRQEKAENQWGYKLSNVPSE